jgi:hypothetical protein
MMTQNDFFNLLENTAAERPKRSEFVNGELEWVTHEREVMQAAVNKERRKANLPALPMDMIIRVAEQLRKIYQNLRIRFVSPKVVEKMEKLAHNQS